MEWSECEHRKLKDGSCASSLSISCKCLLLFLFVSGVWGACPTESDVNIPDNMDHLVPARLYQGCGFVTARISEGITTLGNSAFRQNTVLTTVYLPSTLKVINSNVFDGCSSLKTMDLPDGLLEIGDSSIRKVALTSITLPESLQVIDQLAFLENRALKSVTFRGNSPTTNGIFIIEGKSAIYTADHVKLIMMINSVTSVNLHKDTQIIGGHALCFCDKLTNTEVTIPDSVLEIYDRAFYECGVTHLILGASLNFTDEQAFDNMICLEHIEMPVSNAYFEASDGVLYTSGLRRVIVYPMKKSGTTFTIPVATESFSVTAFGTGSTAWTVTELEVNSKNEHFKVYSGLVYTKNMSVLVKIPPALSGEVTVSESATVIGSGAFYWCRKVTGITLPKKLLEIRDYAFGMCAVQQIVLPETLVFAGSHAFYSSKVQSLEFPSSVEIISHRVCYMTRLASVIIKGAKVIESEAFWKCNSLKLVTLPQSLVSIGKLAFSETGITQITFPEHLTLIGEGCFQYSSSLTRVLIPFGVQRVEDRAFAECVSLTSVTLMNCETWVSHSAFQNVETVDVTCISTARFTQALVTPTSRLIAHLHTSLYCIISFT